MRIVLKMTAGRVLGNEENEENEEKGRNERNERNE